MEVPCKRYRKRTDRREAGKAQELKHERALLGKEQDGSAFGPSPCLREVEAACS